MKPLKMTKIDRYIKFIVKFRKKLISNPERIIYWVEIILHEISREPNEMIHILSSYYHEFRKPWIDRRWNIEHVVGIMKDDIRIAENSDHNMKLKDITIQNNYIKKKSNIKIDNSKKIYDYMEKLKSYCNAHPDKPLVIQNSISRPTILSNGIYYGPTHFSDALLKMNVPTIHLFFSNNFEMEIPEGQSPPLICIGDISALNNISAIAEINISNPKIFIAGFPNLASLQMTGIFKVYRWKIIYELLDDWEAFFYLGVNTWYRRSFEKAMAFQSDKIMAVSPPLIRKMKRFGISDKKLSIWNNGVPKAFIEKAKPLFERNINLPSKTKIAGYWGQLNPTFFDWDAVIFAARQLPQWEFQMIGPNAIDKKGLPSNIKLLGKIPHNQLLDFCKDWELALIPFKNGLLERAVDPIKIYEYLSVGLKVVTLHMEQTERYPITVSYESRQELTDTILCASKMEISDQDRVQLRAFLEESTWENRVKKLCHVLDIHPNWSLS